MSRIFKLNTTPAENSSIPERGQTTAAGMFCCRIIKCLLALLTVVSGLHLSSDINRLYAQSTTTRPSLQSLALFSFESNPLYVTRSERYHIVRRGDTLSSISRQYSIAVDSLRIYNELDSDNIFVGQKIYLTPQITAKREYVTTRDIPEEGYHKVQRGETVYRISKMYGLEIMEILKFNNLESFDIQAGQKIWLVSDKVETAEIDPSYVTAPSDEDETADADYQYHIVRSGENLYRISLNYGMTLSEIREKNSLTSDDLRVGQRLKVAKGRKPTEERTAARPAPRRDDVEVPEGKVYLPVNGQVLSEFGIRNNMPHNGIDIGAPVGEPIHAALDGKVVFVGVQRGYGNVVVLEHADYVMTVYAHNDRNLVRLGDEVNKGQPIATVGQSGNASAPHVHFEYRKRGKAINPRKVLPDF